MVVKVFLWSLSCAETRQLFSEVTTLLEKRNCTFLKNPKEADLIILNTCALCKSWEDKIVKAINYLNSVKQKNCVLIVTGCFPGINPLRLSEVFSGPSFTPKNHDALIKFLEELVPAGINNSSSVKVKNFRQTSLKDFLVDIFGMVSFSGLGYIFTYFLISRSRYRNTTPILTSTGCLGNCSYCAVKMAKGSIHSRTIEDIFSEVISKVKSGSSSFSLLGDDVGAYGQDIGLTVVDLLNKLIVIDNIKLHIHNLNPEWLLKYFKDFLKIFESGRIISIAVSVQSGSDAVLKSMNRKYHSESILNAFIKIKRKFPKIKIYSQVIVGFPLETNYDFQLTRRFLKKAPFTTFYVNKYEHAFNTTSSKYDDLSLEVKSKRARCLYLDFFSKKFSSKINHKI